MISIDRGSALNGVFYRIPILLIFIALLVTGVTYKLWIMYTSLIYLFIWILVEYWISLMPLRCQKNIRDDIKYQEVSGHK